LNAYVSATVSNIMFLVLSLDSTHFSAYGSIKKLQKVHKCVYALLPVNGRFVICHIHAQCLNHLG